MGEFGAVVHEMGWFYGEGTRNEGAKKGGGWQAKCCAGERERGVDLRGKDF